MHDVAVLDDICLPFLAGFSGFFCALLAAMFYEICVSRGFSPDEAAFEICVDDTSAARCSPAFAECPGSRFFGADGEICLQAEQFISSLDEPVEAGFFETESL